MQSSVPQPVFLNVEYFFFLASKWFGGIIRFIFSIHFLQFLYVLGGIVAVLLITSIIYNMVRLYELAAEDKKKQPAAAMPAGAAGDEPLTPTTHERHNPLWQSIRSRILSDTPSDWRLAIIEADIYMDRVLDDKGFHGDTVADKLKQVTPDRLGSVNLAWEAHKVRNRIAHDGAAFTLTMPEARRVLSYYEVVFRDLEVIA